MAAPDRFWFIDAVATGSNHGQLQRNGTPPADATWGTGWVAGTTPAGYFSLMSYGVERAANTFVDTMLPNDSPNNTIGDCWRSETPLNLTYEAGQWSFYFIWMAVTNGSGLRVRTSVRLLKGADPTGSDAIVLLDAPGVGRYETTDLVVGSSQGASGFGFYPRVTFTNEYLFVQLALEIIKPATNVNADANFRNGSSVGIFTPNIVGNSEEFLFDAYAVGYGINFPYLRNDYNREWPSSSVYPNPTGWVVGTTAPTKYSWMNFGVERAAGTFGVDPLPDGSLPDNINADCWRSIAPCYFTANPCTWEIRLAATSVTNASGQDGRYRFRLWKGIAQDGSDAVEIGGGTIIGSTLTDISTTAQICTATVALGEIVFNGDYLFLQIAWEITGAATNVNADVNIKFAPTPNRTGISIPNTTPGTKPTVDAVAANIIGLSTIQAPLTQYGNHKLTTNTKSYWKFDETITGNTLDSGSAGRTLTKNGTTTVALPSPFGRSRSFDPAGSDYYSYAGDDDFKALLQGKWTIGILVYMHPDWGVSTTRTLFCYGADSGTQDNNIQCRIDLRTGVAGSSATVILTWENGISNPVTYTFDYVPFLWYDDLRENRWYHLVLRKNDVGGGFYTVDLWVNGVLADTSGSLGNCDGGATATLNVGRYHTPSNYFYGMIDEIWVEQIAVTNAVIEEEWSRVESHLAKSGPVWSDDYTLFGMFYEFNEFSGDIIHDSALKDRDLDITGAFNITQGLMGRARQLDGVSGNYASTLDDAWMLAALDGKCLIETWIWLDSTGNGTTRIIASYAGTEGGQGSNVQFVCGVNIDRKAYMNWQRGANVWELSGAEGITNDTVPNNQWTHLVFLRTPNVTPGKYDVHIYVNGVEDLAAKVLAVDPPDGGTDATQRFVIGADARDGTSVFYGKINKLRVSPDPDWDATKSLEAFKLGPLGAPLIEGVSTVTATIGMLMSETFDDTAIITDSVPKRLLSLVELVSDLTIIADSETSEVIVGGVVYNESIADLILIIDSSTNIQNMVGGADDILVITDSMVSVFNMSEPIDDIATIIDSEIDTASFTHDLLDTLILIDLISGESLVGTSNLIGIIRWYEHPKTKVVGPNLS